MKNRFLIYGLVLFWANCFGAGLTQSSLNGVATNETRYGTSTNFAIPQPAGGSTNVEAIDSTGHEISIPFANFSGGGGGTIPSTTNLLAGDGSGNAVNSGIPKQSVLTNNIATANIGFVHSVLIFTNIDGPILQSSDGASTLSYSASEPFWVFSDEVQGDFSGIFAGDGSGLTALNASQFTSGTMSFARLPSDVVTNIIFTNAGPNSITLNNVSYVKTNNFGGGGGGGGLPTLGGNGTNETFWGVTLLTNAASGNGISFDGTSFLLDGVNLNTGPGGTIGGIGSGLVQLNGSGISSGTVAIAFLPSTVLTNLAPTNASVPSVIGHTGYIPTGGGGFSNQVGGAISFNYFVSGTNISTGTSTGSAAVADMNGDGLPDIIMTKNAALVVYTNSGRGAFFGQASSIAVTSVSVGVAVADVNGDGKMDAIALSLSGGYSAVFTNNGTGVLSQLGANYNLTTPAWVVAGDLNGDGKPDYVVGGGSTLTTVYTNDGIGNFAVLTNLSAFYDSTFPIVIASFTTNNRQDIAFALPPTAGKGLQVFTNNGTGLFAPYYSNALFVAAGYVKAADFNSDGQNDIALWQPSGGANSLYFYTNNGTGFGTYFTNAVASAGGPSGGLLAADFNQDGKPDVATISASTLALTIVTNSGSSLGMQVEQVIPIAAASVNCISTGDFNADGLTDIAQVLGANGIAIYLNTALLNGTLVGNAQFATNGAVSTTTSSSALPAWTPGQTNFGNIDFPTNYQPRTVAGDVRYNGNLGTATNLPSTNINFGLFPIQTNLISGQLYTNGYNRPVQVQANIGITTAAVTGDAGMALWIISGVGRGTTNYESISTTVAVSLAMSYTNQLSGFIPTNAIYAFTNISSGAGNSATLIGGQIY